MTEQPPNHACFEAAMADILDQLYRAFPAPLSFTYDKAFESAKVRGLIPEHCKGEYSHYHSLYGSTLEFLMREGVVHISKGEIYRSSGVVLTSKGFIILNRPLDSFSSEDSMPLGLKFGQIGRLAGSEAVKSVIAQSIAFFWTSLTTR